MPAAGAAPRGIVALAAPRRHAAAWRLPGL